MSLKVIRYLHAGYKGMVPSEAGTFVSALDYGSLHAEAEQLRADLSESRRLLDEAHRSIRIALGLFKSEPKDFDYYAGMIAMLKHHIDEAQAQLISARIAEDGSAMVTLYGSGLPPGTPLYAADTEVKNNV